MSKSLKLLAFDLGSSNGRGILGNFDGTRLNLEEIHRFDNSYIEMGGMIYWDILHLFANMKMTFQKFSASQGGALSCFGIDAWGNDYGLLDRNGQLLSNARSARHTNERDMLEAHKIISGRDIFYRTGNSSYSINTLYQIYRRIRENDPAIENARSMLMIPDLLAYFCTGEQHSEYTITTTTAMYNPTLRNWDLEMLGKFGISEHILPPVTASGTLCGSLLSNIADEASINRIPYALVGSHDTASAVAALPIEHSDESYAFCSSGTWSLFGIESDTPIFSDEMYDSSFSNEGTVQGRFRPLVNITGLWLIQEARREWKRMGKNYSWDDITGMAATAPALRSFFDPSHRDFFSVASMPRQIQSYCLRTGQHIPETDGEIARCIYESLALKYRWALERLEALGNRHIDKLYIVGGGTQNLLLNQMVADSIGRPVITGPIEGACVGNLLMQALALGELKDLNELRQVVRNSFDLQEYEPRPHIAQQWDDAYASYLRILKLH